MILIARAGRVAAPSEQVWTTVHELAALPRWLAGVREVRPAGVPGFGQSLVLVGSRRGDGMDRRAELIAWRPPSLLAWRYCAERPAGGRWRPTRPDELHIGLTPDGAGTAITLYAVGAASGLAGLRLRLRTGRRWRAELAASMAALAELLRTGVP